MFFRLLPRPRPSGNSAAAFSLVEVVIAVGIFAVAVLAIIGLLLPNTKLVGEQLDATVAQRLAQNIQLELARYGFRNVTDGLNDANDHIYLVATRDGSRVLVTNEDPFAAWNDTYNNYDPDAGGNYDTVAGPLAAENDLETATPPGNPPGMAFRDRYFLIEVGWPDFPQYNNNNAGVMPLNVRVLWPYRLPNGPADLSATTYNDDNKLPWLVVKPSEHSTMLFNVALTP
jgi:type II secretory pathway pseudopilin PulG